MGILDIIYPRACPICDEPVPVGEGRICKDCRKKIIYIEEPTCRKCGRHIMDENEIFCEQCEKTKHIYDEGRALYDYSSMAKSIYRYKYLNRRDYGKFYGEDISRKLGEIINAWKADAIIPIPLHKKRKRERGFNQAEIIAKEMGKQLSIPVITNYCYREKNTEPLKKMDVIARQNNLKNAFNIHGNDVKLKRVILVDDIYTTGSTIDAVAKLLKEHGVGEVYYIALSIGEGM